MSIQPGRDGEGLSLLTSGYIGKVILFHFQLPVPFVGIRKKKKKRKKNEMRFKNDEPNLALSRGTQVQYCTFVPSFPGLQSRLPRDRINIRQAARHLCTSQTLSSATVLRLHHNPSLSATGPERNPQPQPNAMFLCLLYIQHM